MAVPCFLVKTEELIRRLKRAQFAKQKRVEILNLKLIPATTKKKWYLTKATKYTSTPVPASANILLLANDVDVVGIDEAQFLIWN